MSHLWDIIQIQTGQKAMSKCQKGIKMNKSNIFNLAHKLTKKTICKGDCYQVNFGAALKIIAKLIKKYSVAVCQNANGLANILAKNNLAKYWWGGEEKGFDRYYINITDQKCFIDLDLGIVAIEGSIDDLKNVFRLAEQTVKNKKGN